MGKKINKILQDEIVNHTGDLVIEGDVEENSQINLTDGSLTILGSVKNGVKIQVNISESLRNSFSTTIVNSVIMGSSTVIKMNSGGSVKIGSFTSCNLSINGLMIGNVNIDNRIFTDDQVAKLGGEKYKITPASDNPFGSQFFIGNTKKNQQVKGIASATIDGKKYQGKEILIDGKEVWVDGNKPSSDNQQPIKTEEPQQPPKLLIHGTVGNLVVINSDSEMEILGVIGNQCNIKSEFAGLTANNIGEGTTINVRNKISVANVEDHAVLKSKQYGLEAENLKNNVYVDVRDAININGNIGSQCKIQSQQYGLKARNIGEEVSITTRDAISVRNVGANSSLFSSNYGLKG
ncbi:TPA: hypothetical protein ACT7HB_002221, partial [Legionella pneumophila]